MILKKKFRMAATDWFNHPSSTMCDICCAAPVSLYVVTTAPQSTPADPAVAQTDNVTNFQEHRGAEIYSAGGTTILGQPLHLCLKMRTEGGITKQSLLYKVYFRIVQERQKLIIFVWWHRKHSYRSCLNGFYLVSKKLFKV